MKSPNSPIPTPLTEGTDPSRPLTETRSQIAQTARDVTTKIKEGTTSVLNQAKEKAGGVAAEKKAAAANAMGDYSSAIHHTARCLEEKDPNIAWFTHQAANKLQGVADYMRNRDLGSLRSDVEGLARKHPAVFFGGLFLAGLVIGNLVKASPRNLGDRESPDEADSETTESKPDSSMGPEYGEAERAAAGMPPSPSLPL